MEVKEEIKEEKEEKEVKEEKKETKEGILEKTKKKIMKVEHKAEDFLKPVAEKLHMKPW